MLAQLVAEVLQMLLGQTAFEKRSRVLAGRGMALEIDEVAGLIAVAAVEEMVVADFGQGGQRSVGGDVAADAGVVFVGAHHHGHRVPADQALDAPFQGAVARVGHFFVDRNGVDIGRFQPAWRVRAVEGRVVDQAAEQVRRAIRSTLFNDAVERFKPLAGFLCVRILAGYEFSCKHGFLNSGSLSK